ncbi:MAG: hypothetical protein IT450_24220 [Phycisphaerales bacterium]|nr:hypothetical protein [Phycisphaerales bacterium]
MGDVVFNLVCQSALDERILNSVSDLLDVEEFLRTEGRNEAADGVERYRKEIERINAHLYAAGKHIYELLDAAEHWAADHTNENRAANFDITWSEYRDAHPVCL